MSLSGVTAFKQKGSNFLLSLLLILGQWSAAPIAMSISNHVAVPDRTLGWCFNCFQRKKHKKETAFARLAAFL